MIPQSFSLPKRSPWQTILAQAFRSADKLLEFLEISPEAVAHLASPQFPLRVPRPFAAKMDKGNPRCPLLLQVLGVPAENQAAPGYTLQPLLESEALKSRSLLHKFPGRVLLTVTGACAVHCRFCFRKNFPYHENTFNNLALTDTLNYLAEHPEVNEVILSGGDPLTLSDEKIREIVQALAAVPSLHYIRVHTRFPVVIPERVTQKLAQNLSATRLKASVIIHCNHPNEVDSHFAEYIGRFNKYNISVWNQSVLLKNVNNSATVLQELIQKLYSMNVLPYYLHMLDPVEGSQHFEVSVEEARTLLSVLAENLPGFLLPRLVREIPGRKAKVWVG